MSESFFHNRYIEVLEALINMYEYASEVDTRRRGEWLDMAATSKNLLKIVKEVKQ